MAVALAAAAGLAVAGAAAQHADVVPVFAVDAAWPKSLPNGWKVGPVSGLSTDARDHIWLLHRGEAVKQAAGTPAPPVIEFDAAGNVVQTWGGPGPGYEWPQQVHGITIDARDRVWISGNGAADTHILVFTRQGRFLRQIGRSGKRGGSDDTANVAMATQMRVDTEAGEVFVSDGEMNQHHRVIVFDAETGAYKRHWGAYGGRPDDAAAADRVDPAGPPSRQFGSAVANCPAAPPRSPNDPTTRIPSRRRIQTFWFPPSATYTNRPSGEKSRSKTVAAAPDARATNVSP